MIDETKKDVTFEQEPQDKEQADGLPAYIEKLDLSQEQKDRAVKEVIAELDAIRDEREKEHLERKWKALENQYDGKIVESELRQFNLNRNVTKVKVDKVVTDIKDAFFEADPVFAITPRPEFGKKSGESICKKQEDFLDYKLDNLPFEEEYELVAHSATLKGTGWLELFYDIKREQRRREESYKSEIVPLIDEETNKPKIDPNTNQPIMYNKGLKSFLENWRDAATKYPSYIKKLQDGEDLNFIVEYKEITYNDPRPKFHKIEDVFVRLNIDGYQGLKTTRLIAVRENFSYWDLKREEREGNFYDIDKLVEDEKDKDKKVKNYETLDFDIFKCTYYFKINEDDEEETKVILWIHEEKKIVIGSQLYPYFMVDCCYLPHYIKRKKKGIYQPGIAEDLTDSHLAESAILNLTLEAAYIQNTITPITDDSKVINQFLEKRFSHGIPLEGKPGSVDFLQKYMRPADLGGLITLLQYLIQGDDDVTSVSSLMTGRESPIDPSAPATKTLALLRQSGKGIADYVKSFSRSFNEVGQILLAIYYQMSKEGRMYKARPDNVVGSDVFQTITRDELMARTNIQARAYMFETDKINEKMLDLALYQTVRQEPLIAKNPQAVYVLLKNIIEGWSKKWKNISLKVIPSLDDFKKMQIQTAVQGVAQYVQAEVQKSRVTNTQPEFDVQKLMMVLSDLQALLVTPPSKEAVQEMEKQRA